MVSSMFILFASTNIVCAKEAKDPKNICKGIYGAIGLFVHIADVEWKKKKNGKVVNEKKAVLYSQSAANYATIYQTVCKD
jgi:hypothetical protein